MKLMAVFGVSCLFAAAATKPFVAMVHGPQNSSWAYFRSYPYAAKADAEMRAGNFPMAAYFYGQAVMRSPRDMRFVRGMNYAVQRARLLLPGTAKGPTVSETRVLSGRPAFRHFSQPVRHLLPAKIADRRRQTPWRGPIVQFASANIPVAFQEAPIVPSALTVPAQPPRASQILSVAAAIPASRFAVPRVPSRLSFSAGSVVRANSLPTLLRGATEFGGSQSGAEVRWRLNDNGARPLQVAASAFAGLNNRLTPDGRSTQASIGVRYKPVSGINAVVGIDRMIKAGAHSRNAFALRLMADAGDNYDMPVDRARWLHWHAGFDSALIGMHSRDLFASAEARVGMGQRISDQWSVTPYAGVNTLFQRAGGTTTLVEAGPGLWVRGRLTEASRVDVRLAYRFNVAGNAKTKDGAVAQVSIGF
jgi:hypothetical protein